MQIKLSRSQARRLMLKCLHLYPPRTLEGNEGVLKFVRSINSIQFDPLDKAGQNAALVLQSRVRGYQTKYLNQLLYTDRKLIDGWDRNMCIFPVEDWPNFERLRKVYQERQFDNNHIGEVLQHVRNVLKREGPISSLELGLNKKIGWPWGPARIARAALESMYWCGELIIHHRSGTRKYYDFSRKHIPQALLNGPDPNTTLADYHDWHVKRRIKSVGLCWALSGDVWLGIIGLKSNELAESIARLLDKQEILEISVQGLRAPLYLSKQSEKELNEIQTISESLFEAAVIAPLDNLMWNRRLVRELFDFDYIWEVYKPAPKRRYGYYVVPILLGDRFIARFEPVRDSRNKTLIIKGWWWEDAVPASLDYMNPLKKCFEEFMAFLNVERVVLEVDEETSKSIEWMKTISVGKKPGTV